MIPGQGDDLFEALCIFPRDLSIGRRPNPEDLNLESPPKSFTGQVKDSHAADHQGILSDKDFALMSAGTYHQQGRAVSPSRANGNRRSDAGFACSGQDSRGDPAVAGSYSDHGRDELTQVTQPQLEARRAKNRLAATKCRAKQRQQRDRLQTQYQSASARNKRLREEERLLRDAIVFLRDCALQHDATHCSCNSLHRFNMMRAECISMDMTPLRTRTSM